MILALSLGNVLLDIAFVCAFIAAAYYVVRFIVKDRQKQK